MSEICRTFAANLKMHMKKLQYIQPQMDVQSVSLDAFVMLLDSGSGPEPNNNGAPMRRGRGEVID